MKMTEYKIIRDYRKTEEEFEKEINKYAKEGYKVQHFIMSFHGNAERVLMVKEWKQKKK